MKRVLLSALILLCCFAQASAWMNVTTVGGGVPAAGCGGSCDSASNELGYRADGGSTQAGTAGYALANLVTADCAGALEAGYISHDSTNNSTARICLYTDDGDSTPDSGDTLIACSDSMSTGGTAGVKTADIADCTTVSTGTNYWLVIMIDDSAAADWTIEYNAGGTGFYDNNEASGWHDSPPANLGITWAGLNRQYEAWISIK